MNWFSRTALFLLPLGCAGAADAELDPKAVDAAVAAYLKEPVEKRLFTGAVLVAQNGKALSRRAYGFADWTKRTPNTPDTTFMLFSVSKQFTAASTLLLADRGKLSLKDPISKHLADTPPEWAGVAIHHLLSHTSGIEIDNLWHWIENHFPAIREDPKKTPAPYMRRALETPPGKTFRYSNGGYILLSQIVERVSGKPYHDFLREEVFRPLDMTSTGCDEEKPVAGRARGHELTATSAAVAEQPTHIIPGAGDVYSSVDDMLRWDESWYGDRLLRAETRKAAFTSHVEGKRGGFGYAWFLRKTSDGRRIQEHSGSGSGFIAYTGRLPEDHVCVVMLCNRGVDFEYPYFRGLLERVATLLPKWDAKK